MTGRRPDAGMTLVELAVAMAISSVLLAAVGSVVIGTFRATSIVNVKTGDAADLRIGLEAMSRTLRVAAQPANQPAAFVTAAKDQVSFYALLNRETTPSYTLPIPYRVSYTWNPTTGCLNQTLIPGARTSVTDATPIWDSSKAASTCLLRTVTPPAFTYYPDAVTNTELTAPVTGTALPSIQSVQVVLTARDARQPRDQGVPAAVRVSLANIPVPTASAT